MPHHQTSTTNSWTLIFFPIFNTITNDDQADDGDDDDEEDGPAK